MVFFAVLAAWSLSTPLFGGPDEPAQVVHAVAVVRGQLVGRPVGGPQDASTSVVVPEVFTRGGGQATCIRYSAEVSPACLAVFAAGSTAPVRVQTYVGRYPPLYYAIVGLPTLVMRSTDGIWAMRLMSALLDAVFLGLALATVVRWSSHRLLPAGALLAATPQLLFLGGVVNPNGLECSAALTLWCAGIVLALEHPTAPPRGLVAVVTASASVLTLTRGLSPLWTLLILATIAALLGLRRVRALLATTSVRGGLAVVGTCSLLAVAWIVREHSLDLVAAHSVAGDSEPAVLRAVLGRSATYLRQMVGELGWLDTSVPRVTFLVWFVAVGAVIGLAVVLAGHRQRIVVLALVASVVIIPVVIQTEQARRAGLVYQGRYTLPLAEGVPVLAVALVAHRGLLTSRHGRLAGVLLGGILIAQVAGFAEALRRYTVGKNGTLALWRGQWHPPAGTVLSLLWFAAAMTVLVLLVCRFTRDPVPPGSPTPALRTTG